MQAKWCLWFKINIKSPAANEGQWWWWVWIKCTEWNIVQIKQEKVLKIPKLDSSYSDTWYWELTSPWLQYENTKEKINN